jgi:DNA-binding NarL/FixJ family response regulator
METINVLIVDDHPVVRKGMRALLETVPEITLVGEAENGKEAVKLAQAHQPDIILMDLQMPDGNGIVTTRELNQLTPNIKILVVTLYEDDDSIFAALQAGAHGYILKDADEEEIIQAIKIVAEGGAMFGPSIATRVMNYFSKKEQLPKQEAFPELTDREREILTLIARGESNANIAKQLVISIKTVRNYVSSIYNKLQVADRAQAAIRARDAGLK